MCLWWLVGLRGLLRLCSVFVCPLGGTYSRPSWAIFTPLQGSRFDVQCDAKQGSALSFRMAGCGLCTRYGKA